MLILLFIKNIYSVLKLRLVRRALGAKEGLMTFSVEGMNCGSCVKKITKALDEKEGVESLRIDLAEGLLELESAGIDCDEVEKLVKSLGFGIAPIKKEQQSEA